MAIYVLILSYFLSPSYSAITNFSVSGASKTYDSVNNQLYEVYGSIDTVNCSGNQTCNTCGSAAIADTATTSCNTHAVNLATELSFTFRSDKNVPGYFIITKDDDSQRIAISAGQVAANGTGTVKITWSALCAAYATANTNCADNVTNQIFRVGLDADNNGDGDGSLSGTNDDYVRVRVGNINANTTDVAKDYSCTTDGSVPGICNYTMYPGDKKIYLVSYEASPGFPNSGSQSFTAIRMYHASVASQGTACSTASFNHSNYVELPLTKSGTVYTNLIAGDSSIGGLSNSTHYCFLSAVVDQAGNVRGFTKTSSISISPTTPSEVSGMLEEGNCFIATAAYGSPLHQKIDTFRRFRDQVLMKFDIGQKLVKLYYENSKPLAIEIFKYPWAQAITRAILWPLWFVIEALMNYPIVVGLVGLTVIFGFKNNRRRSDV